MRVLFLAPVYVPHVGGLEVVTRQLAAEFLSRGHQVAVVTSHGQEASSGLDHLDGVPIQRIDAHGVIERRDAAGILRVELEILRFTRGFEPDLVHSHDAGPVLWMYLRVARRQRHPLVVTLHNVMTRMFGSVLPILARMLREADWVTGVSQAVVDDLLTFERSVAPRASVIRNGIIPPTRDPSPIPDGPPRLLCVGRLVEQKGFDVAITALARVREREPAVRLTIAGDGPERKRLIDLAHALAVDDNIDFLGIVDRDQVAALLRQCTAVVMPSRFEGFPVVALEAAWAGRPLVAAESPGLCEAVVPGETAVMVPAEDPDALASAIAGLITDADRATAMGERARILAADRYLLDRCADEYEAVYRRVLERVVC